MKVRFYWVFPLYLALGTGFLYHASDGKILVDRPIWRTPVESPSRSTTGQQIGNLIFEISDRIEGTWTEEIDGRRVPRLHIESPDLRHLTEEGGTSLRPTTSLASPILVFYRLDEGTGLSSPMLRVRAERALLPGIGSEWRNLDLSEPITLENAHIVFEPETTDHPPVTIDAPRVTCSLQRPADSGDSSPSLSLEKVDAYALDGEPVIVRHSSFEARSSSCHWRAPKFQSQPIHLRFGPEFEAIMAPSTEESTKAPSAEDPEPRRTIVRAPGGLSVTWQPPSEEEDHPSPGLFDIPDDVELVESSYRDERWEPRLRVRGRDALVHFSATPRGSARIHEVDLLEDVSLEGEFGELKGAHARVFLVDSEIERLILDGPFLWRPSEDTDWLEELFPAEDAVSRRWESRAAKRFSMFRLGPPTFFQHFTNVVGALVSRRAPSLAKGAEPYVSFFVRPRRLLLWEGQPWFGAVGQEPVARAADRISLVVDPRPGATESATSRAQPMLLRAEGNPVFEMPDLGRARAKFIETKFAEVEDGPMIVRLRGEPHVEVDATETMGALDLQCRDTLDLEQDGVGLLRAIVRGDVRMNTEDPERGPQELACQELDILRVGLDAERRPIFDIRARGDVTFREPRQGSVLIGEALHLQPDGFVRVEGWPARVDMLVEGEEGSHLVKVRSCLLLAHPEEGRLFAFSMPLPVEVEIPKSLLPDDPRFQEFEGTLTLEAHVLQAIPASNGDLGLLALLGVDLSGPVNVRCQTLAVDPEGEVIARFGSLGGSRVEFDGTFEGEPLEGHGSELVLHQNDRIDLHGRSEVIGRGMFEIPSDDPSSAPRGEGESVPQEVTLRAEKSIRLTKRWVELHGEASAHQRSLDPTRPSELDLTGEQITLERDAKGDPVNLVVRGGAAFRSSDPLNELVIRGDRVQYVVAWQKLEIRGSRSRPAAVVYRSARTEHSLENQEYIRFDLRKRLIDDFKPFREDR